MRVKDWQKKATIALRRSGVSSPELDSIIMLESILERDRSAIRAHDDEVLPTSTLSQLDAMVERRTKREPLAYILGYREFYGLAFKVGPAVLVPRPETEVLVEHAAVSIVQKGSVLEIGTGSGAIAVALKSCRPDLTITATDVSHEALEIAGGNAVQHKTEISFLESDLFNEVEGRFDVVLANLPYVPEVARRQPEITFEPDVALYGGQDGLDYYRSFFSEVAHYLLPDAQVIVEFSPTQYAAARREFTDFVIEPLSEYIYVCKPLSA